MHHLPQRSPRHGPDWAAQIFDSRAARTGGIVRRAIADVEREMGRDRLELEVRRRRFRLIEAGDHFVILCQQSPVRILV